MGKEYSTDKRWSNCNRFTTYYENIKVIFTKIAKAGSSNWVEALLIANGDITSNLTLSERSKELNSGKFDYHLLPTARKFYSDEVYQDAFSFTALRNPWTRMVSGYRNKLEILKTKVKVLLIRECKLFKKLEASLIKKCFENCAPHMMKLLNGILSMLDRRTDISSLKYRFFAYLKLGTIT